MGTHGDAQKRPGRAGGVRRFQTAALTENAQRLDSDTDEGERMSQSLTPTPPPNKPNTLAVTSFRPQGRGNPAARPRTEEWLRGAGHPGQWWP